MLSRSVFIDIYPIVICTNCNICQHIEWCQVEFTHLTLMWYPRAMSKREASEDKGGSWIFRNIPRDLMKKAKIAAAVEGKSIKALLMEALVTRLQELERKGLLPKGKP